MTTQERLQRILEAITQKQENAEDMTEALSILGVNINE